MNNEGPGEKRVCVCGGCMFTSNDLSANISASWVYPSFSLLTYCDVID